MTQLPLATFDIPAVEFHRRAAWAQSNGYGPWLWPDIRVEEWRAARESITRALAETLIRGHAKAPLEGDREVMSLAAYTAGIGPLLGRWIAEGRIVASEPLAAVFDLHLRHNRLRMERMLSRATTIVRKLALLNIPVTVLKGMHTAFVYFPDPATRPASDIDLLVSPTDAERANSLFQEEGFLLENSSWREKCWRALDAPSAPRSLLLVHEDGPWTVDLHNSLNYSPRPSMPPADLDQLIPGSPPQVWPGDPTGGVLAQPMLLLHLAVHLSHSMVSLAPLRMAELVLVIRRDTAAGTLVWQEFLAAAVRAGALGIIFPALYFSERLVPTTVPPEILEASAAAAPRGVRRHLERLTPATAQRMERITLAEHFMWANGWQGLGKQAFRDVRLALSARRSQNPYLSFAAQLFKPRHAR
jgi:hypothetical protein